MNKTTLKPLVVTTVHKGVFFGYSDGPTDAKTIKLERCRMCIYWSNETRGVLGLAAKGPQEGSKVTPAVPSMTLQDVTAAMDASDDAIKAWEKGTWS